MTHMCDPASVEIAKQDSNTLCIHCCSKDATGELSFTTVDNNQPPYQWESFKEMGWPADLSIAALGFEG